MEIFNPDLLLPQELTIESVDEHLYRIGLCLTPNRHNTRRSLIFHPILIAIMSIIMTILRIATLFTDQRWQLLLLGDVGQFFGMRIYFNLGTILLTLFLLSSQLIYYYNNKRDIRPTFLTLFHMMSGSVSPASIGLTDEEQVIKLISLSRKLFIIVKYQCKFIVPMLAAFFVISPYLLSTSPIEIVLYGIPATIIYFHIELYFWTFFGYQYLYFYLVCKYLDMKLKNSNEKLIQIIKSQKHYEIRKQIISFNAIYCEIKEYDSTYISKFLFQTWIVVGIMTIILIYVDVFISSEILIRISVHYVTMLFFGIFIFTIITAASINYDNRITYKLLNSLNFIIFLKMNYSQRDIISAKYKVTFFQTFKFIIIFSNQYQLTQFIERVAKRKVGFTCWSIFIIDYFRCYGVMSTSSEYLIKFLNPWIIILLSRIFINLIKLGSH